MISRDAVRVQRLVIHAVKALSEQMTDNSFDRARNWFAAREDVRESAGAAAAEHVANVFRFLEHVYGAGHEIVMLLTELNADLQCLAFVRAHGCEAYDRYNKILLLKSRDDALRQEISRMLI